jgi:hypothetical protein
VFDDVYLRRNRRKRTVGGGTMHMGEKGTEISQRWFV